MKKILITMLIFGLIALTIYSVVKGMEIGEDEIYSIEALRNKNEEFELQLAATTSVIENDYTTATGQLNSQYTTMKATQKKYQEKLEVSTSNYKLEKLFVKLGNHAASEGVSMNIDVTASSEGIDLYNLSFTIQGTYMCITDFISTIENDSELGFKIEQFKVQSAEVSTNKLTGTFICKDIMIEEVTE